MVFLRMKKEGVNRNSASPANAGRGDLVKNYTMKRKP